MSVNGAIDGFQLTSSPPCWCTEQKRKKSFGIMQNMSHKMLLFCAPTWPSYHETENHLDQRVLFFENVPFFSTNPPTHFAITGYCIKKIPTNPQLK